MVFVVCCSISWRSRPAIYCVVYYQELCYHWLIFFKKCICIFVLLVDSAQTWFWITKSFRRNENNLLTLHTICCQRVDFILGLWTFWGKGVSSRPFQYLVWRVTVWQFDSVTVWQCDSLTVWSCDSMTVLQCDSMTVWQCYSVTVWQCDSVTVWQWYLGLLSSNFLRQLDLHRTLPIQSVHLLTSI